MTTSGCAFHHHRAALTTGFMLEPCARDVQDQQLCCAHNERGSPRMRAAFDLLRERGITTPEQDHKLRLAMHHIQRNIYAGDFNTNFMVALYVMQEKNGPVCDADRHSAKAHDARVRKILGMGPNDRFEKSAIDAYARRAQDEASAPARVIELLLEELRPLAESGAKPRGTSQKIDAVLAGLPAGLFEPLPFREESPWFQRASSQG